MKKYFPVFFFLFACTRLAAQSITPLTSEFGKKAAGSFTVTNNGLRPLNVTLEKRGFTVSPEGVPTLTPLPAGVRLELGVTSTSIGIGQSHTFFYKMTCDTLPCHAQVLALMMSGEKTAEGFKLALGLPTVIYVCEKKKNCRADTLRSYGYDVTLAAKK
jgi:hypothetical protein